MKCIPCRVTLNDTRFAIAADGTVRMTWVEGEPGLTSRKYSDPVAPELAADVRQEAARQRRNRNTRERHQAMRDLGLVRCSNGSWE